MTTKLKHLNDKTNQSGPDTIKSIMKREKISAAKLSKEMGISDQALRKRLRGASKFSFDEFVDILNRLGYNINIVKESDIIKATH